MLLIVKCSECAHVQVRYFANIQLTILARYLHLQEDRYSVLLALNTGVINENMLDSTPGMYSYYDLYYVI